MFRIMTLNISYYGDRHGPWSARKALIAEAIDALQPDVVALQAVQQDPAIAGGRDQAAQLADLLGNHRHVHFAASMRTEQRAQGSALLARLPLKATRTVPLSFIANPEDQQHRALVFAEAQLDGQTITVANGHFSWVPEVNARNTEEMLAALTGPHPTVFVGDLNADPDSDSMQRVAHAGWIDAWSYLHRAQGYTFESQAPTQRIDYIWLSRPLVSRLRAIDVIAGSDGNGTRLSDHLGLIATFD